MPIYLFLFNLLYATVQYMKKVIYIYYQRIYYYYILCPVSLFSFLKIYYVI